MKSTEKRISLAPQVAFTELAISLAPQVAFTELAIHFHAKCKLSKPDTK